MNAFLFGRWRELMDGKEINKNNQANQSVNPSIRSRNPKNSEKFQSSSQHTLSVQSANQSINYRSLYFDDREIEETWKKTLLGISRIDEWYKCIEKVCQTITQRNLIQYRSIVSRYVTKYLTFLLACFLALHVYVHVSVFFLSPLHFST